MLSLLFGDTRKAKIGVLELDASLSERHEFENIITDFPIETGGEVSDHIYMKPDRVMIQGFITNSPPVFFDLTNTLGRNDRVGDALETLKSIRDNRELVTVVTGLIIYDNMAMKRLTIPRSSRTGETLRFTAEFVKITKVASETAGIPEEDIAEGDEDIASSPVDVGSQATTPTNDQGQTAVNDTAPNFI